MFEIRSIVIILPFVSQSSSAADESVSAKESRRQTSGTTVYRRATVHRLLTGHHDPSS